jgi:glycosyltransferase involved in cell wall biosynthesis
MAAIAVTIFVPALNEFASLEDTIGDVLAATATLSDCEIIVVDDGSTDGTGKLADDLAVRTACVRVLHNPTNLGLAAGYRRALAEARMPYFTFVPGDREVSAQSVKDILGLVGSADVIVPYHANSHARAWHRRLLTRASTALINLLFGFRLRYYQGPCVYPTALARSLRTTTNGFFFLAEMLVRALSRGHSYVEVGLIHQERSYGHSKAVSLRNIGRALATIVRLWWSLRVRPMASRAMEKHT